MARPVRFKPMAERIAIVTAYNGLWVHHEFTAAEAAEMAGEFAKAILESEAMTAKADATWDLKRPR